MKSRNAQSPIVAVWLMALLVGGCAPFQPLTTDASRLFRLEAEMDRAPAAKRGGLTLQVSPPRAWPGYDSANMVYVRKPYELESFVKNQWVDTPARMLAPLLARALERSVNFRTVVQSPTSVVADMRLDTEIVRLQQEFTAHPSRMHLTLRAQLVDLKAGRVMASSEIDLLEDAPSDDPYGGVIAANRAVQRALEQLIEFTAAAQR
jgi:cholesterol transport system auxiliary component